MIYEPLDDRELAFARSTMNSHIEMGDTFDPSSLDGCPSNGLPPPVGMFIDDALQLCDERASSKGPYMPWEIML